MTVMSPHQTTNTTTAAATTHAAAPAVEVSLAGYDAEQVRLMEEMCILVDGADRVTGFESKKNTHLMTNINAGMLHRAFSVFLFDADHRLLLQQRADEKITFPGYWTNTCCSHPLAKQDELVAEKHLGARTAAVRKLDHELGITAVGIDDLQFLTRIHYLAPSDGTWGEHEVDYIFVAKKTAPVAMVPSPNEVKATRYVTRDELRAMFKAAEVGDIKLTPWFRLICESFLFQWWDHLDAGTLDQCVEPDTIHKML
ncbi:isopentenyl-diphosphate delta-isomerase idi1 [Blastocladiella emersonii ATCC 22665]|nr:isopentenyl-diphosphate delta-isomerase idi1 [Blastocladiella emersonii ATCC 22665]